MGRGEKLGSTKRTSARGKNPNAVALGKLGGPKGGRARDDQLSHERKVQIARKGARARWGSGGSGEGR